MSTGLDLSGQNWDPIDDYAVTFEGNDFTISNLYVFQLREGNAGLFGYVTSEAVIRNVVLSSANVTSGDHNVGALVGRNSGGAIINSSVINATTLGWNYVGGLVGRNDGTVTDSSSSGAVTSMNHAGGLVGRNDGTVTGSSSSAAVNGITYIGGLVGSNQDAGTISNSSSSGNGYRRWPHWRQRQPYRRPGGVEQRRHYRQQQQQHGYRR